MALWSGSTSRTPKDVGIAGQDFQIVEDVLSRREIKLAYCFIDPDSGMPGSNILANPAKAWSNMDESGP